MESVLKTVALSSPLIVHWKIGWISENGDATRSHAHCYDHTHALQVKRLLDAGEEVREIFNCRRVVGMDALPGIVLHTLTHT
jgi:hypothetical protein